MQTVKDLYNQALSAIGHAASVSSPDERSQAAQLCNLWYAPARRAVFGAFHWPSLRFQSRLSIAAIRDTSLDWQESDPAPGYLYSYAMPTGLLRPQFLHDFSRFEIGNSATEQLLYSNTQGAVLYYTKDLDDPSRWSADLYNNVVYSLAASINMAKSGKMEITQRLEQRVQKSIADAAVADANTEDIYFDAVPTSWAGTGFSVPVPQTQYFYPTSTFLVAGV